jgi:hypothetical protein
MARKARIHVPGIIQHIMAREDVRNAGCWVIGDPEFVQKVIASDKNCRARIACYLKEGFDIL